MSIFTSFDVKSIEFMCKMNILWWLEMYEPADWRDHGNYLYIHADEELEWYFDMAPGEYPMDGNDKIWNVGFAVGDCEFYWLYRFNPYALPDGFDEKSWNQEEFHILIHEFEMREDLNLLHQALCTTKQGWRRRLSVDKDSYYISQQPYYVRGKKY